MTMMGGTKDETEEKEKKIRPKLNNNILLLCWRERDRESVVILLYSTVHI
jgi:hypothetical protein